MYTDMGSSVARMFAVLLGGKGTFEHQHRRASYHELAQAIEDVTRGHCVIGIEAQQRAADFVYAHGPRTARRYARALRRQ